jgi:type VI secretion system protein ImpF
VARTELHRTVQPSLLDRLTDLEPEVAADRPTTRDASERDYRAGVQRDVEQLLNTRRTIVRPETPLPQLARSVYAYGIPDTSGLAAAAESTRKELLTSVADTLRRFEPRLGDVVVAPRDGERHALEMRFAITATLRMDPSPEQIVFDTVVEVASGTYDVNGTG